MYPMTIRPLSHHAVSSDGSQQHMTNFSNLDNFQMEAIQKISELQTKCHELEYNLNSVKDLVAWIGLHRPEAINDYHTTNAVAKRLQDSNDFSEADMIQEMQVTP